MGDLHVAPLEYSTGELLVGLIASYSKDLVERIKEEPSQARIWFKEEKLWAFRPQFLQTGLLCELNQDAWACEQCFRRSEVCSRWGHWRGPGARPLQVARSWEAVASMIQHSNSCTCVPPLLSRQTNSVATIARVQIPVPPLYSAPGISLRTLQQVPLAPEPVLVPTVLVPFAESPNAESLRSRVLQYQNLVAHCAKLQSGVSLLRSQAEEMDQLRYRKEKEAHALRDDLFTASRSLLEADPELYQAFLQAVSEEAA